MNELCLLTGLTSSDIAAWAQAAIGVTAIVAGAFAVWWQTRRARLELCEREASALDGIALLLGHLKDAAVHARNEKTKIERWPAGHPAEPSSLYLEVAQAVRDFPLDSVPLEVAFEALLVARRTSREIEPLVDPTPELDEKSMRSFDLIFGTYMRTLDTQIIRLRDQAEGRRGGHAMKRSDQATTWPPKQPAAPLLP
jgi:hypothetical protein